ncbi:MAG: YeeE/YedE thiosulfate transporter family protein [Hyphomicrobiales bacterium]
MITATEFTPLAGALGGALIGLSAVVLLATAGRIAGASFIFRGLFTGRLDGDFAWKALFMAGLLAGALLSGALWFDGDSITFPTGPVMTAVSGLLVGFGVTISNGCTSGHGICGLARLSKRSLVATCTFMAVAIVTVFIVRHVAGA